jgi:RecB family exonuclease
MSGSLSYSSLSEFERCGYRFYLERVLRLPEDRAAAGEQEADGEHSGLDPRIRGTLVHSLMETLDFTAGAGPSPQAVARLAGSSGLELSAADAQEIAGLLAGAAAAAMARRIAAARLIGREYPFALALADGEPLLRGFIDLLAEEPGGACLLVDYKSDRVGPGEALEQTVRRDYGVQRELYALAALRRGAERVEVVHWFLARPQEPVAAVYEADRRGELEASLAALVARARAGRYEVSPQPHRSLCLTCPGRQSLCSWGEEQTLRPDPREPQLVAGEQDGPLRLF